MVGVVKKASGVQQTQVELLVLPHTNCMVLANHLLPLLLYFLICKMGTTISISQVVIKMN